ncbi:hypothetical protein B0H16DRAFT_1689037 [Mycena metata]|uniref:Uncharacterized protein n=1 Tax=Mycena metata TaxID=1033252 RepID=A0AAD7NGE3_9AGAR|nr:hypothetical protein B0H16DRAFT_1689037 [Mycena metata]
MPRLDARAVATFQPMSTLTPVNKTLVPPTVENDKTQTDLEAGEILATEVVGGSETVYEPYHDLSEIPYIRFGYTEPIVPTTHSTPLDLPMCLKALGDERWPGLGDGYEDLPSLLTYLLGAKSLGEIPRELLDLRQDNEISSPSNW